MTVIILCRVEVSIPRNRNARQTVQNFLSRDELANELSANYVYNINIQPASTEKLHLITRFHTFARLSKQRNPNAEFVFDDASSETPESAAFSSMLPQVSSNSREIRKRVFSRISVIANRDVLNHVLVRIPFR